MARYGSACLILAAALGAGSAELPAISLAKGEHYFRVSGNASFLLGRNPTGWKVEQFEPLLQWASESGEVLARIHLTSGMPPRGPAGEIDEAWAREWEHVFAAAARRSIYVLPVLGVWADWNDGSKGETWHRWHANPYNAANGGPAARPAALFADTPCRRLWLRWLGLLARRWATRPNILAWEVFSELDLVSGASEDSATAFVAEAARVVRAADPCSRPVTASLSGIREWPKLFASEAVDIVQVHPYANHPRFRGRLDAMIVQVVRQRRKRYGKPVLIGECGLDARPPRGTLTVAPRAHVGIAHALWAAAVSGAACGRMLWWEDGYDQYQRLDLRSKYKHASAPVARFVKGISFSGFRPIGASHSKEITGAALGHPRHVIGWFRDAQCEPPDWAGRRVEDQAVTLTVPGAEADWRVQFCSTSTGQVLAARSVRRDELTVRVPLPPFENSIAFRMVAPSPE